MTIDERNESVIGKMGVVSIADQDSNSLNMNEDGRQTGIDKQLLKQHLVRHGAIHFCLRFGRGVAD